MATEPLARLVRTVRLEPDTAAGQAAMERLFVHMEALGHGWIPWHKLPASEQRRLRIAVARQRLSLRDGGHA